MTSFSLAIRHLRQYQFCPRIPWLQEVANIQPPRPVWVHQGQTHHNRQEFLSRRRKLSRFNLTKAECFFDQAVRSMYPAMHGRVDLVLASQKEVFIVDFKLGEGKPVKGHILQAAAYGLAAEQTYQRECPGIFVATGKKAKPYYTQLSKSLRAVVRNKVEEISNSLVKVTLPDSPATIAAQCSSCEYLNYCNDRD